MTTSTAADRTRRASTIVGTRSPRAPSSASDICGETRTSASHRSLRSDSAAVSSDRSAVVPLSTTS